MIKWYEDYANVVSLAMWLDGECDYFIDPEAAIRLFEKPWKYSHEWQLYELWNHKTYWEGRPPALRQHVIDAVIEERSVEQLKAEIETESYE